MTIAAIQQDKEQDKESITLLPQVILQRHARASIPSTVHSLDTMTISYALTTSLSEKKEPDSRLTKPRKHSTSPSLLWAAARQLPKRTSLQTK